MDQFDNLVNKFLSPLQINSSKNATTLMSAILYLFLIIYSSNLAGSLPDVVKKLFKNVFFRIACLFLILYITKYQPSIAILAAIAFVITLNVVNTGSINILESMENTVQDLDTYLHQNQDQEQIQTTIGQVTLPPIVVKPQVVETENGKVLATPEILLSQTTTLTPDGQVMTILPKVSNLTSQQEQVISTGYNSDDYDKTVGCFDNREIDIQQVSPVVEDQGNYYDSPDQQSSLPMRDLSSL